MYPYTLSLLPIVPIDALAIVASTKVGDLQTHVILKIVPLVIPHIRIGARIIMLKTSPHASKVFTTPIGFFVDTHVVEQSQPKLGPLTESTSESVIRPINEIIAVVKQVDFDFVVEIWLSRGILLTQIFIYCK
jgi:hypothetical protein